jgi:hypothetical protein
LRCKAAHGNMQKYTVLIVILLVGCSAVPQKVSLDDDRVRPLLAAAAHFDRTRYGFSPIPTDGSVTLESVPNDGYDAMLHFFGKTARTMAFRKTSAGYVWIGEQELFQGPKKYSTPDGVVHEAISLTYDIATVSGYPLNRLNITYYGEDPRLAHDDALTLKKIKPILQEWGY